MAITADTIPTIPSFRLGQPYHSLTEREIRTANGQEILGRIGWVNPGVIRRDLRRINESFERLQALSIREMCALCARAADLFTDATLPVTDELDQTPQDYIHALSGTGGLPHALIRANMRKIADVLINMPTILKGLTRGLNEQAIETGSAIQNGIPVSFYPTTTHLGLVLPSNSPGVNSLWLPALALRVPVLLKPGREDPWTPWRLINALITAGCPAEAFGFYPADHDGANVILSECQRVILFGDANTVSRYVGNPRVSVHGPGYSKIIIGEDCVDNWESYLDRS